MFSWRLALILLASVILLGIIASTGRAESAWIHGIVQDDQYQPVSGGRVWLERKWGADWLVAPCCDSDPMQSHSFGWDVTQPGRYRIQYEKRGYNVVENDIVPSEFTVPGAPTGDIQVNVKSIPVATATPTSFPVPTTLYPPTVDPTRTATPTPTAAPCLDFQQFTWAERRSVIATAASYIGRELEATLKWDDDLTLLHGLQDMMLGAPLTMRFEVMGLTARGFCNAIIVMRPVAREECLGYGVVGWDGTQNWMVK